MICMEKINNELKLKQKILNDVLEFYLNSRDCNGVSFLNLYEKYGRKSFKIIKELVKENKIDLHFSDLNPHVMQFDPVSKEDQLGEFNRKLKLGLHRKNTKDKLFKKINIQTDYFCCCLYPDKKLIAKKIKYKFMNKPFSRELALNRVIFDFRVFDNKFLLPFVNDPRYHHHQGDYSGSISYSEAQKIKSDQKFIPHYYFALKKSDKSVRQIAMLLCDLHDLPSSIQKELKKFELNKKDFILHPISQQIIYGNWPEYISIFSAFCYELKYINKMCIANFSLPLFKKTYEDEERPINFTFLVIPTEEYYQSFLHTLDIMISDNINLDFFKLNRWKVKLFKETQDHEGNKYKQPKGALNLLKDWLLQNLHLYNPEITIHPANEIYKQFNEIRKLRSMGKAHNIIANKWDESLFKKQIDIIKSSYEKLRLLRLILANLPKKITIDKIIYEGKILCF